MKTLINIGLYVCIVIMTCDASSQEVKKPEVSQDSPISALNELAAEVGKQMDAAGNELKAFLKKSKEEAIEDAINVGIKRITSRVEATPKQAAEIKPILRKDVDTTGEILDEALAVGMAAARVSLKRSLAREWRNVRAELSRTLSEEQLSKADKLHAELAAELIGVFEKRVKKLSR